VSQPPLNRQSIGRALGLMPIHGTLGTLRATSVPRRSWSRARPSSRTRPDRPISNPTFPRWTSGTIEHTFTPHPLIHRRSTSRSGLSTTPPAVVHDRRRVVHSASPALHAQRTAK
jgi:hypothetical protein